MSSVEYTSYYVGHGAMHYVRVINSGRTVIKILIDAGSNQDDSPIISFQPFMKAADKSFDEVMTDILDSGDNECIFCLTHLHADHYTYFVKILKTLYGQFAGGIRGCNKSAAYSSRG